MPSLSIGDNIEFHYEDSGPVKSTTYATLVFIHGMGFNGGVFRKLFPLAAKHDFRVVSLYRRDYAPTTPWNDAERKLLVGGPEGHKRFLLQDGLALSRFLDKFITESGIPAAGGQHDDRVGGIILVGWSLGCVIVHSMIANLDALPPQSVAHLEKYLHTAILHDPSSYGFGFTIPTECDVSLLLEPDDEKRFSLFKDWLSAYYYHQDIKNVNLIEWNTPSSRDLPVGVTLPPPTFASTPSHEVVSLTSVQAFAGSDTAIAFIDPAVHKDTVRRAVFDKTLAVHMPKLHLRYFNGGQTLGILVWSLWQFEEAVKDPSGFFNGETARDVAIIRAKRGNHFNFWDDPEDALVQYRLCINTKA